ncbi:MAG: TonB-dependent receptor, partial [Caulobacterales bacterium]|nr:TonB-dependent receptor [Caulobacterales bacterium]
LVNRGSGGTLWANPTGFITATNVNTGRLETSGIDLLAAYDFELGNDLGSARAEFTGTWINELITQPLPNSGADETFDCVGLYGSACGNPNPEFRWKARGVWTTPIDLDLSLTWRYFSSVDIAESSSQTALTGSFAEVNATLDSQSYFDLAFSYPINNVQFRGGINTLADRDPPLSAAVGAGFGNGNTFPQVYDALGRYIFFGATVDF